MLLTIPIDVVGNESSDKEIERKIGFGGMGSVQEGYTNISVFLEVIQL